METALRETEEESGIKRSQIKLCDTFRKELVYPVQNKTKTSVYFLGVLLLCFQQHCGDYLKISLSNLAPSIFVNFILSYTYIVYLGY